ncbi:MAG: folate-binding protein YgfZ [Magnetococcales bacterium]|nr:folate-binding protein YgfZ [Magnetococcales bacterium]
MLLDLTLHEIVSLAGADHRVFLGGLVTNQVNDVTAGRCVYAAHLTPQGRFLWDFTMLQEGDRLLLIAEPGTARPLMDRLNFYRLRAKVTIAHETSLALLGVAGPDAGATLSRLFPGLPLAEAPPGAVFAPEEGILVWADPRHAAFGWRMLMPVAALPAWRERLSGLTPPVDQAAWEDYRIRHALPLGGRELIPEEGFPLEGGLLEMHGVSFTKGCYVGQETTARTHHRGTLKKRVFSLMLSAGEVVAPGSPILLPDGKPAGVLTSVTAGTGERAGLGLLYMDDVERGKPLTVGGARVTARKPDWATW